MLDEDALMDLLVPGGNHSRYRVIGVEGVPVAPPPPAMPWLEPLNLGKVVSSWGGKRRVRQMTSPNVLTDPLDTYMDLLGLVSIVVVVAWLVRTAFR
jgi:hypothetical protein